MIYMTNTITAPKANAKATAANAKAAKAAAAKAAKAATDAIEAKTVETIVTAFKAAYSAELTAIGQLADIQATIATNRVYMVRSLVKLAKVPAFKYRGGLNQSRAAESLGVPRTSLANHMKAIAVFIEKGIEVAAAKPEKWELAAVATAWGNAAEAAKASKAKAAKAPGSGDEGDEGDAGETAPPKAPNADKVTSAHEDAVAMAESLERMVSTFAGTWSAKELNDLILSLQTTVDFLEDIATA